MFHRASIFSPTQDFAQAGTVLRLVTTRNSTRIQNISDSFVDGGKALLHSPQHVRPLSEFSVAIFVQILVKPCIINRHLPAIPFNGFGARHQLKHSVNSFDVALCIVLGSFSFINLRQRVEPGHRLFYLFLISRERDRGCRGRQKRQQHNNRQRS